MLKGGIRQQLKLIYGPAETYDSRLPLTDYATGKPFGEVRVGVNTALLKSRFTAANPHGRWFFPGSAILLSLILSAGLSNLALRPLASHQPPAGFDQLRQG